MNIQEKVFCVAVILSLPGFALADEEGTSPTIRVEEEAPMPAILSQGPIDFAGSGPLTDTFKNLGVIFYGSGGPGSPAYVRPDGDNPTSPVLAGCDAPCQYLGPIGAQFVDPITSETIAVTSVRSNAGYFNTDDSTALTAYDEKGNVVDQLPNGTGRGIISMSVSAKGTVIPQLPTLITRAEFANFGPEDAGFAIDLFSFEACSLSGKVQLPASLGGVALPVAIVLLVPAGTSQIAGFGITDINGWYCIAQDPPSGDYHLVAIFKLGQLGPWAGFVLDHPVDAASPQRQDITLFEVH